MTDLVSALAANDKLSSYKGKDVLRTSIAIRNAGDGLSQAMAIQPAELEIGQRVFVVLECDVAHHDYGPIKDTDCLELKQVLRAEGATLVEEGLVREHLDEMADRIKRAQEEARGVQRLALEGDEDEADAAETLVTQHRQGVHDDGPREGCPMCAEAQAAEAVTDANADAASEGAVPIETAKGARKRGPRAGR